MFDIITFGSATRDTFLRIKKDTFRILDGEFPEGQALCFPLGSKIFIENLNVFTGGGGTNTACTFSNQGFKTAYCGKIGNDKRGEAILEDLKKFKVDTGFIKKDKKYLSACSIILSLPHAERTILIYRGACHFLQKQDISFNELKKTKWFYLAPLSGEATQLFGHLVKFAKENNIKVASNLGDSQLNLKEEILKPILAQIDILILNEEEASLLSGIKKEKEEEEVFKKISDLYKGILVITKDKKGSMVSDGKYVYSAGAPPVLPLEKTGAGDAFASGFLSGLLQKNDIEYAIQLATANATGCIQKIGAKNGLLKKGELGSWPLVKVEKNLLP
ncbi:carbohydrate kinase family protein [Patescibacteria group bacterium]|nr:carbohydrate kinase family protein [Patescibacteria group bacterium]